MGGNIEDDGDEVESALGSPGGVIDPGRMGLNGEAMSNNLVLLVLHFITGKRQ